jgi:cytochrome P450
MEFYEVGLLTDADTAGITLHWAGVHKLEYVLLILKESLRLWPTAPAFSRFAIGGRYELEKGQEVIVLTPMLHRDRRFCGKTPEAFDLDRFTRQTEHGVSFSDI